MRKNVCKVINALVDGKPAIGDSKRTCSTDGTTLYSYRMPVARIVKRARVKSPGIVVRGKVQIVERERAPSNTTRSHVDAARAVFKFDMTHAYDVEWVESL